MARLRARTLTFTAYLLGLTRTVGFWIAPRRPISRFHWPGLQHGAERAAGADVLAVARSETDVDVVIVVAHRERVVRARVLHERDDLVRLHRALQLEDLAHRDVRDRALALVADDRRAVHRGDVHGAAGRVLGDVAARGVDPVAALQARHRRLQAACGEVLEQRQHAPVDDPRTDVLAPARVEVDVRVREHAALERLLAHQQDLADRRVAGGAAEHRVLGAEDPGRGEQAPAVEDRRRVDPRRALAGRADLEAQVHPAPAGQRGLADAAEDRAGDDPRALLQRQQRDLISGAGCTAGRGSGPARRRPAAAAPAARAGCS